MTKTFFLFQTPDERLASLNDWAARDYTNVKLVDALAGDADAQARKRAETLGLPPDSEATQAELDRARSALYRSAIQGAFAKNDIDAGLALHGRAASNLTPADATALDPLVNFARERKIGREYADGLPSVDSPNMPDLKQAHLDATAQNEADWPDDDSQRATNQHFIDVKFGKAMRDALDTQAELRRSVADWLTRPGPDGEAQTERPPVAMWTALSPEERDQVDHILRRAPWATPLPRPKIEWLPKPPKGFVRPEEIPERQELPERPKLDESRMYPPDYKNPRAPSGIGIMPAMPPGPLPRGLEWLLPWVKPELQPPEYNDHPSPKVWPDKA